MNSYYLNDEWYKSLKDGLYSDRNFVNNSNTMNIGGMVMNNPSLVTPSEGYNRGNLFANLYDQYRNYRPVSLRANNEQERLFLELSRMSFAAHEINLYLDLNPNDESMLRLFNDYRQKCNELTREYEAKFGPLTVKSDSLEKAPFMWEKNPWPWEDRFNV